MFLYHLFVIHTIEVIPRQDEELVEFQALSMTHILSDGVRSALVPVVCGVPFGLLFGRQYAYKSLATVGIKVIGSTDMLIEALGEKLGEDKYLIYSGVEAV
ncbi:hypothetical protein BMS3Bbin04_00707 [bacterium BMS3Bbin04]|nr:hypothetical protein BMS3Bbin04_00707 [bacterium BMS3Bbin04]